ncbi:MAG: TrbI/VirB10 family protein [Ottowia sp.]
MNFPGDGSAQPQMPDNMPKLSGGLSRGLNKMALAYVAVVAIAVIGMAMWVVNNAFSNNEEEKGKQVSFEDVSVPERPVLATEVQPVIPPPPLPPELAPQIEPVAGLIAPTEPIVSVEDDLLERRMAAQNNLIDMADASRTRSAFFEDEYSSVKRGTVRALANADFVLTRGTFIRCTLETKVVSTLPGMTSCIVTEPIYSVNGRRLLIGKGSKVTGEYKYVDENYDRIGIVWTRVLTTTGLDVRIDSQGTDALGGTGVPGHYNGHWGERIGAALLVSLLADAVDIGAQKFANDEELRGRSTTIYGGGYVAERVDPWDSATVDTAKKAAAEMLARSANRKATVTVLNGTVISIFAARDVDFSSVMQ